MAYFKYMLMLILLNQVRGLSLLGAAPTSSTKSVSAAFLDAKISPKYIPTPPEGYLHVVYGVDDVVHLGNGLTPLQCALPPSVTWDADPDQYYVFMMLDLDAVYPELLPLPGVILHWGRYNIKGGDMTTGEDFAPYLPVTPPPGSDPHRYIQVVYQQQGTIDGSLVDLVKTTMQRLNFDNQQFVTKNNLGDAKFGNYFLGKFMYL